jgi:hypothetical protein
MLYAVLGALAQFERDVLREPTVAGIQARPPSAAANTLAVRRPFRRRSFGRLNISSFAPQP